MWAASTSTTDPNSDPAGFRDRLLCLLLKEGGFRLGELLGTRMEDLDFGKQGVHVRFRADNQNGARAKAGYGRDRFVHLPFTVLGLLDVYITEVWIEANPRTDHLWIVLKKEARDRDGQLTVEPHFPWLLLRKCFNTTPRSREWSSIRMR